MKDCDIVTYGVNAIVSEAEANEAATDTWIDNKIQVDSDHKAIINSKFFIFC